MKQIAQSNCAKETPLLIRQMSHPDDPTSISHQQSYMQALEEGSKAIVQICQQVQKWADEIGKPKRTDLAVTDATLDEEAAKLSLADEIKEQYLKTLSKPFS